MRNYGDSTNPNLIHNHPVMIKAIASQKSLLNSNRTAEDHKNNRNIKDEDINDTLESA